MSSTAWPASNPRQDVPGGAQGQRWHPAYLHLGTGITTPAHARDRTDLSLLTCKPAFGEDATNLFNLLSRVCQFQGTKRLASPRFELAPAHDRFD